MFWLISVNYVYIDGIQFAEMLSTCSSEQQACSAVNETIGVGPTHFPEQFCTVLLALRSIYCDTNIFWGSSL
jgi:hypothetical protein